MPGQTQGEQASAADQPIPAPDPGAASREGKVRIAKAALAPHTADAHAVYLAGSLFAGLGTPTSDVDVFVVLNVATDDQMLQVDSAGERVDIEFVTLAAVSARIRKATEWSLAKGRLTDGWIPEKDIDFVVRLLNCEILSEDEPFRRMRLDLEGKIDRVRQILLARWTIEAGNHLEDYEGAFADRDWASCQVIAQSMALAAGKAMTVAAGDLYFGRKWLFPQLRRSLGPAFPIERCLELQQGRHANPADYLATRRFVQTCLAAAQTVGWLHADAHRWPWRTGDAPAPDGPIRALDYLPVPVDGDRYLLNMERRRQLLVNRRTMLVWALCDGRPASDVVADAVEVSTHLDPDDLLSPEQAQTILAKLAEAQLVGAGPVAR